MSDPTVVLITGANSGVGYATAKVLASSPKYHVILACRDVKKGQQAESELQSGGISGKLSVQQLDVTDDVSIAAAVEDVKKDFGRLDVLVSNAATLALGASGRDKLRSNFDTNVFGALLVTEAFVPLLLKSTNPYIIQVTSGLGSLGGAADPNGSLYEVPADEYRMTKAALNMAMIQMHKRLKGQNVRVFAFCPGLVRSNLRGPSEEDISAGGVAGDPMESGRGVLDIVEGKRDGEVGQVVRNGGTWPW